MKLDHNDFKSDNDFVSGIKKEKKDKKKRNKDKKKKNKHLNDIDEVEQ